MKTDKEDNGKETEKFIFMNSKQAVSFIWVLPSHFLWLNQEEK